jgi:hypothetical protein
MTTQPSQPPTSKGGPDQPSSIPAALLSELGEALRSIRFGAIELVIHDGRVVHLEKREKVRFGHDDTQPKR